MKKKNRKKKILLALHKYLGLATGLIVFIVAVTGCCWCFKEEIQGLDEEYKKVEVQDKPFLKASVIKHIAKSIIPNKEIHGVKFGAKHEVIEVIFYQPKPEVFYQSVFLNPYTGAVLKQVDHQAGFFGFVLKGHTRLWLPKKIGSFLVSYGVLLFLFIIITGVLIWWPKKVKNILSRLKFKWNGKTKWKRKNFDLHTVLGFYTSSLGFLLAFTGCIMAFGWFYYIVYKSFGGNKNPRFIVPESHQPLQPNNTYAYDDLIPKLYKEYPNSYSFELHYPTDTTGAILVEAENSKGLKYDMDYLFFDQNTLEEKSPASIYGKYQNTDLADKVIRMNYDIHIGAIGGLLGKILAFVFSLLCASLPVTGVLIWYGRNYKKK